MKSIDIYMENDLNPSYKIVFLYHLMFFFSVDVDEEDEDGKKYYDFEGCFDLYNMKSQLEGFAETLFSFPLDYEDEPEDFTRFRCHLKNTYCAHEKNTVIDADNTISFSKKLVIYLEQEKIHWDINQKIDRMNPFIKIQVNDLETGFYYNIFVCKWPIYDEYQTVFNQDYFLYSPEAGFSSEGNRYDVVETISHQFWKKGICPSYISAAIIDFTADDDCLYTNELTIKQPISITQDSKIFSTESFDYNEDVSRINLEKIYQELNKEYESQHYDEITPNYNDSKENLDLLFNAVKADDVELIKSIMKDIKNMNSYYGFEPFIFSVIEFITVEILKLFIKNDLDLDDWDSADVDLYNRIQWDATEEIKEFIEPLFE